MPPNKCLFCTRGDTFQRMEHPIPESLGNDDTVLPPGFVCDSCNQYFGSKLEREVLAVPPFNVERVAAAIRTKKGRYAKMDSPDVSLYSTGFWDQLVFSGHTDWCKRTFMTPDRGFLLIDPHPRQRELVARFLLKMGLELLLFAEAEDPYARQFDAARNCAREGRSAKDWEVAYGLYPKRGDLVTNRREDEIGPLETRQIYQYEMGAMPSGDRILMFLFINHCFACNLSRPALDEYLAGFNAINQFELRLMA